MFETAVLGNAPAGRRAWSTCIGFTCQAILVGCLILVPVLFPDAMPAPQTWLRVFTPSSPLPPPPPAGPQAVQARSVAVRPFAPDKFYTPAAIPQKVAMLVDEPAPAAGGIGVPGGIPGGQQNGVPGGILTSLLESSHFSVAPSVPAPAAKPKPADSAPAAIPRYKMGGIVKNAVPIRRVEPVYPLLARQMRVSGDVHITGVIGIDGRMKELRVLDGNPLLVGAALDAVRQWLYAPTTLNDAPVEVIAPITVTFRLN